VARVAPGPAQVARRELHLARRLAAAGSPVATPEPRAGRRVHERDGFAVTLWTYHEPRPVAELRADGYAAALARLHAGLRAVNVPAPRFTRRVDQAHDLVADRDRSPALADADRELLLRTLRDQRRLVAGSGAAEQLLHGEPHPGNVLVTRGGPLFVDLETVCRGPVEFDLAHAPDDVALHYPDADPALLRACRTLTLAIATAWRWDREDQLPDGRRLGREWLALLRAVPGGPLPGDGVVRAPNGGAGPSARFLTHG
jgi:Ser/Thr protein kinase RdoA (MazF antagonist)